MLECWGKNALCVWHFVVFIDNFRICLHSLPIPVCYKHTRTCTRVSRVKYHKIIMPPLPMIGTNWAVFLAATPLGEWTAVNQISPPICKWQSSPSTEVKVRERLVGLWAGRRPFNSNDYLSASCCCNQVSVSCSPPFLPDSLFLSSLRCLHSPPPPAPLEKYHVTWGHLLEGFLHLQLQLF